jgi:uncharacterized cupin superfamily protein
VSAANTLRHFNVYTDQYTSDPEPIFGGYPSSVRELHRSPDGRILISSRKYPDGADYRWGRDCHHDEAFFLVEGEVRCTPVDGESIIFKRGEVIYYPAGLDAHWEYSQGSQHLAFFWSDQPLGATNLRESS